MNAEYKQKWIEALRSGEYNQTTGVLMRCGDVGPSHTVDTDNVSNNSFCCLGVLSQIVDPSYQQWNVWGSILHTNITTATGVYMTGRIYLGHNQLDGSQYVELADMNDHGFTFDQIADIIDYFL